MPYCFEHQRISGPGPIDNQRISDLGPQTRDLQDGHQRISDLGPQTRDVLDGHSDLDPRWTRYALEIIISGASRGISGLDVLESPESAIGVPWVPWRFRERHF